MVTPAEKIWNYSQRTHNPLPKMDIGPTKRSHHGPVEWVELGMQGTEEPLKS